MTAIVNPVRPLNPPYYHREYSNDVNPSREELLKRIALVALPFFSLCEPLKLPISLVTGATRVYTTANQLIHDMQSGDCKKIAFNLLQTTTAIVGLASTIFSHPIGMIVTTSQDIIFPDFCQNLNNSQLSKKTH